MPPVGLHIEVELSVSQYVCQSVRPSGKKTSTLAITFALLKIETWYLACVCTSWSWTFLIGERSSFKVKCQIYGVCPSENFNIGHNFFNIEDSNLIFGNIGHNFFNIEDSNLIFGVHVYLMKLHILSGGGSRSSFKVKGKKINTKRRNMGHCVSDEHISI